MCRGNDATQGRPIIIPVYSLVGQGEAQVSMGRSFSKQAAGAITLYSREGGAGRAGRGRPLGCSTQPQPCMIGPLAGSAWQRGVRHAVIARPQRDGGAEPE